MILEGILTTKNMDGSPHWAPMGPVFERGAEFFELKPFQTSTTYQNLVRERCGVFHVSDNVYQMVQAITGQILPPALTSPATQVASFIVNDACRAYEFEVEWIEPTAHRSTAQCRIVQTHHLRDFYGFNRAKHALLEAAIYASRIDFLPWAEIREHVQETKTIVEKTGGPEERIAWQLLVEFFERHATGKANPV